MSSLSSQTSPVSPIGGGLENCSLIIPWNKTVNMGVHTHT